MFCPKCGKELDDRARYCGYCGYDLNPEQSSATQQKDDNQKPETQQAVKDSGQETTGGEPGEGKSPDRKKAPVRAIIVIVICAVAAVLCIFGLTQIRERQFNSHMEAGQAYMLDGDYEEVVAEFTSAIDIDPKVVEPYIQLADAYAGLDDNEMAEATFDDARVMILETYESENVLPDNTEELYVKAITQATAGGNTERADELKNEIEDILPEDEKAAFEEAVDAAVEASQLSLSVDSVQALLDSFADAAGISTTTWYSIDVDRDSDGLSEQETEDYGLAYEYAALALLTADEVDYGTEYYEIDGDIYPYSELSDAQLQEAGESDGTSYYRLDSESYKETVIDIFGEDYDPDYYDADADSVGFVKEDAEGNFYIEGAEYFEDSWTEVTVTSMDEDPEEDGLFNVLAEYTTHQNDEESFETFYVRYKIALDDASSYGCIVTQMERVEGELSEEAVLDELMMFEYWADYMLTFWYYRHDDALAAFETIGPAQAYSLAGRIMEDNREYEFAQDGGSYKYIDGNMLPYNGLSDEEKRSDGGDYVKLPMDKFEEYLKDFFGMDYSAEDFARYEDDLSEGWVKQDESGQLYVLFGEYGSVKVEVSVEYISDTPDANGNYKVLARYDEYTESNASTYFMQYQVKPDSKSKYGCVIVGMVPAGNGEIDPEFLQESGVAENDSALASGTESVEWMQLYADYIEQNHFDERNGAAIYTDYELIYVNGDDVPEITCRGTYNAAGIPVLYIQNGEVKELEGQISGIEYTEYQGYIYNDEYNHMGMATESIAYLDNNCELTVLGYFSCIYYDLESGQTYDEIIYGEINGEEVTKSIYDDSVSKLHDFLENESYGWKYSGVLFANDSVEAIRKLRSGDLEPIE